MLDDDSGGRILRAKLAVHSTLLVLAIWYSEIMFYIIREVESLSTSLILCILFSIPLINCGETTSVIQLQEYHIRYAPDRSILV